MIKEWALGISARFELLIGDVGPGMKVRTLVVGSIITSVKIAAPVDHARSHSEEHFESL
jgi:hypothetical protein